MHGSARNGKGKKEMRKFWNDVNECLIEMGRENKKVLIGDMNGKVGNKKMAGVVGKWGVDGVNESGDYLCRKGQF